MVMTMKDDKEQIEFANVGEFIDVCELKVSGGPPGRPVGHPACRPLRPRRFSMDTGMRPVSKAFSGDPGEVPDGTVSAHLGNRG
jgi:hypothetical protein